MENFCTPSLEVPKVPNHHQILVYGEQSVLTPKLAVQHAVECAHFSKCTDLYSQKKMNLQNPGMKALFSKSVETTQTQCLELPTPPAKGSPLEEDGKTLGDE